MKIIKNKYFSIILLMAIVFTGCMPKSQEPVNRVDKAGENTVIQTPKPEKTLEDKIKNRVAEMTIDEKIGQLFIVDAGQNENGEARTSVDEGLKKLITEYKVGGIILFKNNIKTKEQTIRMNQAMQDSAEIPLWIGVDEEGGKVSRVGSNPEIVTEPFKEAYQIGQTKNSEVAYEEAKRMGTVLKEMGFNIDFAPVADIFNNPKNKVIGTRSFGNTAEKVTPMVIGFAKGLKDTGILPVIKHFPGHGNTVEDSHEGFAYVHKTMKALEKEELRPFRKGLENGIQAMMIGHLIVPDMDKEYPATLSTKWGAYIKAHYPVENTLIFTDAMNMGAIAKNYSVEDAVTRSILAGVDIIVMPKSLEEGIKGVKKALEEQQITEKRIEETVIKILSKKAEQNLFVPE